jgi:hypothetical protein
MSILTIFVQIVITVLVVLVYHLLVGRERPVVPPAALKPVPASPAAPAPAPVAPAAAPVIAVAAPKPAPADEAPSPEILAVIAAAIAVVLDRPHKLVAVQPTTVAGPEGNVWAMEGRVEQFLSHRVR